MTPDFAALADAGWPALERTSVAGWEARFASGVTKRANSAWPGGGSDDSADSRAEGVAAVERLYRARSLPPVFQLSDANRVDAQLLIKRGYVVADETLVLAASVSPAPRLDAEVTVADSPDDEWLAVWWSVDGRGEADELEVARRIMTGVPALYATLRAGGRADAVARLALVGAWGGLYCVATLPEHRRRGYGERVVRAVLAAGAERGVTDAWLQVLARNDAAVALYSSRFGFAEVGRYRYLVGRLQPRPAAVCRA